MAVNNLNTPGVGIQPSLIDAKGDLLVGTANDAIDRLGVTGTTGAVLTADAGETTGLKWAAAGSVGGLVHIETQDFNAVSGVNFDEVFSAEFNTYKIISSLSHSVTNDVEFRLRLGTTDNTAASYHRNFFSANGTSVTGSRTSNATVGRMVSSDGRSFAEMYVTNPFLSVPTGFLSTIASRYFDSSETRFNVYSGGHNVSSSFDGINFIASSGTIAGLITVLGVKKQ
jgi:hypothetical protein